MAALVSTLCLLVVLVGTPAALVARWMHGTLADRAAFATATEDVRADPAFRSAVASEAVDRLLAKVSGTADPALLRALRRTGVPPSVLRQVQRMQADGSSPLRAILVARAEQVIGSAAFDDAWEEMVTSLHDQVLGRAGTASRVSIDLDPLALALRQELVDDGVAGADRIPRSGLGSLTVTNPAFARVGSVVRWWDARAAWAPWAVLGAGLLAVASARRRLSTAGWTAAAAAAGAGALLVAANAAPSLVATAAGQGQIPDGAVSALADALLLPLSDEARQVALVTAVVALLLLLVAATRRRRRLRRW